MTVALRPATEVDAPSIAALLTELGYPSQSADVNDRLLRSLHGRTSRLVVAQLADEIVGLMAAELVPYFPTGATVCRVTALVVGSRHRGSGFGKLLLTAADEFARAHYCSGIELTSAERRIEAHAFYERQGYTRTAFRFFKML
jgi:ribosomal protein S18 acetylase RimI-like enzyme